MRLLDIDSLEFTEFHVHDARPKYVIASHRWVSGFETTFKDVKKKRNKDGIGFQKVEAFARYVRENVPSVKWIWIDTCCIDKDSATELSRSINLMFEWYRNAELCLAYLPDVEAVKEDRRSFGDSEWFKRGWTLQELLAPRVVVFLNKTWQVIGNKGYSFYSSDITSVGPDLGGDIARITGIPEKVLRDYAASVSSSTEDKLKWIEGRETTCEEDMSYALFGIVGVTPGANYGEGYNSAKQRLSAAIRQRDDVAAQKADQYQKIASWLSPPDPWSNHESARQRHEPDTGAWLLQSSEYQVWKSGSTRCLWVHGKAGCGKTILCFTAVEDMRTYCKERASTGHAIFYFSFSDNSKQTYENLLRSLVVQLGWKEPGLSMLHQAYGKPDRRLLGLDELQNILLSSVTAYDKVFLHLDGLDECPEGNEVRQNMLECISDLLQQVPNIRMLATSRDMLHIRFVMEKLGAKAISIAAQIVNADIQRYVSHQISRNLKLSRLDPAIKTLVEETLSQKADGMFRWVYCQLQELKKSKSTSSKSVKAALLALPATLDETYERMLNNIDTDDYPYALTLLRWLGYAQSPPSLGELAEANIIDPNNDPAMDGVVDIEKRGGWGDTLEILAGLVTIDGTDDGVPDVIGQDALDDRTGDLGIAHPSRPVERDTKVRLAHFSIKEYLESPRILASNAKEFYLDPAREHRFLAQSCLVYLLHYSNSAQKTSTKQDLAAFPLLEYAAESWFYHVSLQQCSSSTRELRFLTSENSRRDWLRVHNPDQPWNNIFEKEPTSIGTGLYYASLAGLEETAKEMLDAGADVNAQGGNYGNALQAASSEGHEKVVQMLIEAGADVNAQGGDYSNALQAASSEGHEKVVQMLIEAGADVNAQGGDYGNALQAASSEGHKKVVQMLIEAGADVNAQGGFFGNALQAASFGGHEKVVQMLIEAGADVNAQGGNYSNALQAASSRGHEKVVQMLIEAGADVNAQGGNYSNALQAASSRGYEKVVQMLMEAGADVNAQGEFFGNALQAASSEGHEKVVQMLIEAGADVNAQGGNYGNALQAASSRGYEKVVQMLIEAGADVNAQGGNYGNALQAASSEGHEKVVQMLIEAGADVNAQGGNYSNALQAASSRGHEKVVQMLIEAGADVNAQGGNYSNALQAASSRGYEKVVQMLMEAGADVNAQGGNYSNALQAASSRGHEKVVDCFELCISLLESRLPEQE